MGLEGGRGSPEVSDDVVAELEIRQLLIGILEGCILWGSCETTESHVPKMAHQEGFLLPISEGIASVLIDLHAIQVGFE